MASGRYAARDGRQAPRESDGDDQAGTLPEFLVPPALFVAVADGVASLTAASTRSSRLTPRPTLIDPDPFFKQRGSAPAETRGVTIR